ncbi:MULTISPECIES: hypothetical protein [Saccharibacillus]|uniref:hypothetical protein n=1 Tax=Saccharibacillus TaxID=456492 RepID=UPI001238F852|nr:hypothetical protein [Saccharibacillus sp. WB 17]MWJ33780.1 hypothetical protein [Saccharibacillus sp. WB 17]
MNTPKRRATHKTAAIGLALLVLLLLLGTLTASHSAKSVKLGEMMDYARQHNLHNELVNPVLSYYLEVDREAVRHYFGSTLPQQLELELTADGQSHRYPLQYQSQSGLYANYDLSAIYFDKATIENGTVTNP